MRHFCVRVCVRASTVRVPLAALKRPKRGAFFVHGKEVSFTGKYFSLEGFTFLSYCASMIKTKQERIKMKEVADHEEKSFFCS